MRWLVTGAAGMLGSDLCDVLATAGEREVTAAGRDLLDITDAAAVDAVVAGHHVVLNAAAWTDVDAAEQHEAQAALVNGRGVENLARACAGSGALLLHVSTDYVFPGDATAPYPEDAPTGPVNAYGRTKLLGEGAVADLLPGTGYVVRTAWLYGPREGDFVSTMLRLAGERDTIEVVDDQVGQPTWSWALAAQLVALAGAAAAGHAPPGIYHGTASGETSRYGLAREVFALAGHDPGRVRPTSSAAYPRPARRPTRTVLGHDRWALADLPALPPWRAMLAQAMGRAGLAAAAEPPGENAR
jgi:dTDP-4-dehydrorhamnose reductase